MRCQWRPARPTWPPVRQAMGGMMYSTAALAAQQGRYFAGWSFLLFIHLASAEKGPGNNTAVGSKCGGACGGHSRCGPGESCVCHAGFSPYFGTCKRPSQFFAVIGCCCSLPFIVFCVNQRTGQQYKRKQTARRSSAAAAAEVAEDLTSNPMSQQESRPFSLARVQIAPL